MRSGAVAIGILGGMAVALTACSSDPDRRCVDTSNYKTVADSLCRTATGSGYADTDRYQWFEQGGNSAYVHGYHRYYGSGSSVHSTGGSGGTVHSSTGGSSTGGSDGVARGGLGSHGSGSSGG